MTTESQPNTKALVSLTPRAAAHVQTLFERKGVPDAYLRVAVAGGGCSGMSYKLDVATEMGAADRVIPGEAGVRILVDMKSALYIAGITIDYDDDLMNAGFKFINPNAKSSCGCGESFST